MTEIDAMAVRFVLTGDVATFNAIRDWCIENDEDPDARPMALAYGTWKWRSEWFGVKSIREYCYVKTDSGNYRIKRVVPNWALAWVGNVIDLSKLPR